MRLRMPTDTSTVTKYMQDIPKFVENFRLTEWLELGKGFIRQQEIMKFKAINDYTGRKYTKFAKKRKTQGFITHGTFLAQEMLRINEVLDIAKVDLSLLFDIDNYDNDKLSNRMYGALFVEYIDIDEKLVPDEYKHLEVKFDARDAL